MAKNKTPDLSELKTKGKELLISLKSSFPQEKKLQGVVVFLLLMLCGGLFAKITTTNNSKRDLTRFTVTAISGRLPGLVTSSGELKAIRSVNISPKKSGLLEEVFVNEGDQIEKDQLIAKMKSGDYQFRLNEFKSNYERQKSAYTRRKELFKEGAISAEESEKFKNLYLTSQAKLEKIQYEVNELNIKAPFKGTITNRYADPGAFVSPSTRASSLAGSTSSSIVELAEGLEAVAKVPESDIGRIKVNQKAKVRVDAFPDERFSAKVKEIAPQAIKTNNVTSFEVKLLLIDKPTKLRIGMTADIEFQTGETKISTLVPTVSIVTESGKPGVLTIGKKNQPIFKKVELGTSSGSQTAIIKGVEPGELVFIDLPPWAKRGNTN
tara:strand:+ start:1439 stop:2578 length:1140 start_codon:yes stop_codon:yes gene_type:complete